MERIFDITKYGAIGDGETDCTAAVQAAIDAAAEVGHAKVVVPPGIYMVGHLHFHGQCVAMEGCSAWSFRSDGASVFRLNTGDTDCMMDISGAFGCNIRGMCLWGNHLGENVHGIKLYWEKYNGGAEEDTPAIDDCRVGGFTGDGLHFEHVWCFSVRHSMLHRNGGAGLYIDGWDAFIIDNWFTGNTKGGILGGPVVASITCTGNRVEWNRSGGFILPYGDSFNITGNFFDRSFGPALQLGGPDKQVDLVTVTGNIFRRSGAYSEDCPPENLERSCHMIMSGCTNTTVVGNTMRVGRNDGGGGVTTPHYGFIIENCADCIIKDNTMARGSLDQNIVLRDNADTCIVECNIGGLAEAQQKTNNSLLN